MDIPVWLDTLVCQLMEKDPDKRPLNAAMVEQVLEEVREKVDNQRSVGASVAGKVALRPKSSADRKAAEMLVEARKKKRKKDRQKGSGNLKTILAASGLGLALLAIIAVLVLAFWPDGPKEQYLAAERLVKKGEELIGTADPDAAKEAWYDAERKLENILARPNHPYAAQAQEQLDHIRAGVEFLALNRQLQNKTDWAEVASETESGRRFVEKYENLLKNFPRENRYVVKAIEKIQPLHAPHLYAEAEKLLETGLPESWAKAAEQLRVIQDRYPLSEEAKKVLSECDWVFAWEKAKAILDEETKTGVPRVMSLNAVERDATNAMALEKSNYKAAEQQWRDVAGRTASFASERPWIRLAKQMLKRPPPKTPTDQPTTDMTP
jgi:hypothetical protein